MENTTDQQNIATVKAPKAKKPVNIWMIVSVVLLIVSIGLGYLDFMYMKKIGVSIKPQDAANLALAFVKSNYDQSITLNKVYDGQTCFYKLGLNYKGNVVSTYVSMDGKSIFPADPVDISKKKAVGNFETTNDTACAENGKPIIYFFGTSTCPHCQWEKPVIEAVAQSFGDAIVYKEEISTNSSPFADASVFSKYSPSGGVPVLVLGCKYSRVGSGESDGIDTEKANLTKLICELTNNQPSTVCK
jgi:thiol-disulfide isomerase/thioredoxin